MESYKVTKVTYTRKFNLGNYQSEDFGVELEIAKDDATGAATEPESAMKFAIELVNKAHTDNLNLNRQKA